VARKIAIIDANINRAREGLRVIEDISRFVLEDKLLTQKIKKIRHELSLVTHKTFGYSQLVFSRSTGKDVGQEIHTKTEKHRQDLENIVLANFLRAEEAIRVLEEFSKTINTQTGLKYKKARYELYSVEEETLQKIKKNIDFKKTELYVVLDSRFMKGSYETVAKKVLSAGVKIIQLRDKKLDDKRLLSKAKKLRTITYKHGALLIINDRPDIALCCQADGVHLGQSNIPLKEARRILGEQKIIGFSTHSLKQALQATKDGADYISVGPIFPTKSKKHVKTVGLDLFVKVNKRVKIPIVAIGGIDQNNISKITKKGAKIIGVINAAINQKDITKSTKKLVKKIRKK